MATQRRRVGPGDTPNAPQAETFRALDVPHIGPQKMGDAGAPFEQLAHSLGGFSNALGDLAGGLAYRGKQQLKDHYDYVNADIAAHPGARAATQLVTGVDETAHAIKRVQDAQLKYDGPLDKQTDDEISAQNVDGWTTGRVQEGEDWITPKGPAAVGDPKGHIAIADIDAKYATRFAKVDELWPQNSTDNVAIHKWFGEKLKANREKEIAALATYQSNERNANFETVVANGAPAALLALKGKSPDEVVSEVQRWTAKLGKDMNADKSDATKQGAAVLRGLRQALQNDDNYELATVVPDLLNGKMGTTGFTMLTHKNFASDAEEVRKLAADAVAKRKYQLESESKYQEIKAAALNGEVNIGQLGMEDKYEYQGGTKTYTLKTKDLIARLGKERDDEALTVNGIPREEPMSTTLSRVVFNQQGTGVTSPYLKGVFEDFSLGRTTGGQTDPKLDNQLAAYEALRKGDPHNIGKYITDAKTRDALDIIYMLQHNGFADGRNADMSIQDAARIYMDRSEAVKDNKASETYSKSVKEWFDGQKGLSPVDKNNIKTAFDYLNVDSRSLTEENVGERLDEIKKNNDTLYPTFNDQRIDVPTTEVPSVWLQKMSAWEASKGFKEKLGLTSGSVEYQRVNRLNGYYLMDPKTGMYIRHKDGPSKGEPVLLKDSLINDEYDTRVSAAQHERLRNLENQYGEAAVAKGLATRNEAIVTDPSAKAKGKYGGPGVKRETTGYTFKPGFKSSDKRSMNPAELKQYSEELKNALEEQRIQAGRVGNFRRPR